MNASTLAAILWPRGSGPHAQQAYVVLDGARDKRIVPLLRSGGAPFECLYAGELSPALRAAAPYLVQIAPDSRFFKQLVPLAWGNAWGVFIVADPHVTLQALRRHLRTLLKVRDEQKRMLVVRFYDPRVLRHYLPTCTDAELHQVFGPIANVILEGASTDASITYRKSARGFAIDTAHPTASIDGVLP